MLIALPIFVFVVFCSVNLWLLYTGHPHEDAYILMIYARNLAEGHGIAYFAGGEPTEGATDFLWMLLLALSEYLGSDAALVAAILNGLGLSIISFFAVKLAIPDTHRWQSWLAALILITLILSSQISQAALVGFSTALYCAGVAILFCLIYYHQEKHLIWIPVVSIVLGLFRPDGVIMGVTASVIGLYFAYQANQLRRYLTFSTICVGIGLVYFAWRLHYFGHWLPLPVIVKNVNAETLPGLSGHIGWASRNFYLGIIAISAFAISQQRWRIIVASIPAASLLTAFLFATQTQNVADRFQAPATTVLILWGALLLNEVTLKANQGWLTWRRSAQIAPMIILLLACADSTRSMLNVFAYSRSTEYINTFPYLLSPYVDSETTMALTEAGRFAYWLPGRKFDLVGLNTVATALEPVTPDYIEALEPELIFVHVASTASFTDICESAFCELTPQQVQDGIHVDYDWSQANDGVYRAPLAVYAHLQSSPNEYRVYTALYNGGYNHIYMVRRSGRLSTNDFETALEQSFKPEAAMSYWQLRSKTADDFTGREE